MFRRRAHDPTVGGSKLALFIFEESIRGQDVNRDCASFFYTQFKNFTKTNYLRHYLQHTLLHYKDHTPGSILP